jgi:hypothetical protein
MVTPGWVKNVTDQGPFRSTSARAGRAMAHRSQRAVNDWTTIPNDRAGDTFRSSGVLGFSTTSW